MQKVKHSNLDDLDAFCKDLSEPPSCRERPSLLLLLLVALRLLLLPVPFDKLNFHESAVAVVDVSKPVRGANW